MYLKKSDTSKDFCLLAESEYMDLCKSGSLKEYYPFALGLSWESDIQRYEILLNVIEALKLAVVDIDYWEAEHERKLEKLHKLSVGFKYRSKQERINCVMGNFTVETKQPNELLAIAVCLADSVARYNAVDVPVEMLCAYLGVESEVVYGY